MMLCHHADTATAHYINSGVTTTAVIVSLLCSAAHDSYIHHRHCLTQHNAGKPLRAICYRASAVAARHGGQPNAGYTTQLMCSYRE